ncbi:Hypothetical predicted protein [Octopus vulgaris]|uniref:Uncharacterized protein n=1 Tax=Octopus vulgaris TaxID=6645 RepID=A0AA36F7H1_OCTVU|nr:Hypothetical predicted protein [Octopus vulgaris]
MHERHCKLLYTFAPKCGVHDIDDNCGDGCGDAAVAVAVACAAGVRMAAGGVDRKICLREDLKVKETLKEILNIIESGDGAELFIEEINDADKLQLVLHPPNDDDDLDKDDALSDCKESSANFRNIDRGILAEKGEIRAYSKAGVVVLDIDKVTPSSLKTLWHRR